MIRRIGYTLSVLSGGDAVTPAQTSDAAAPTDQRGPLVRAPAAAHDNHPSA